MLSLTVDTNCLIAVAEDRPEKSSVLALANAAERGRAHVAVVASSAGEKQLAGGQISDFGQFRTKMKELGLGHLVLLAPIGRWGLTFWDHCVRPTVVQSTRELEIFRVLFPTTEPDWPTYAAQNGLHVDDLTSPSSWKWRNKLCDVQAYWAHDDQSRDIFVTSDKNFKRKLADHPSFKGNQILEPGDAAGRL